LAVGGGIKEADDIKRAIQVGADKVVINTAALGNPELISEGARLLGDQCIVVSIDAKQVSAGRYEIRTHSGTRSTGLNPAEFARKAQEYGAGEILLTSIDRDGSQQGYDLDLIRQVVAAVKIPVIVCGGAGHPRHFQEAIRLGVSAVAAANFFHYWEHSVTTVKSYLKAADANIRLDSYVTYQGFDFDERGRLAKKEDFSLEKLFVEYTPEERI
jgi:imidazole glycerol-phosphate synthase subunit HisF